MEHFPHPSPRETCEASATFPGRQAVFDLWGPWLVDKLAFKLEPKVKLQHCRNLLYIRTCVPITSMWCIINTKNNHNLIGLKSKVSVRDLMSNSSWKTLSHWHPEFDKAVSTAYSVAKRLAALVDLFMKPGESKMPQERSEWSEPPTMCPMSLKLQLATSFLNRGGAV